MSNQILKIALFVFYITCAPSSHAQVLSPKEHFGFNIGDSYHLTNYTQTEEYFKKIAAVSDRVLLSSLGLTEEGRNQYMMIVSSPSNLKNIDHYQEIARSMALGEMDEETARRLSTTGKAVVWIDGGLHSTETVASHQLIEMLYQLTSRNDRETLRILDEVIVLLVHANPDGHELMGNWYMQESIPQHRKMSKLPVLYQKYAGHDNNRDFFTFNLAESRNMARPLFIDWIPQIVFNHHQSAPAGAVVVGPPYRDPFNYVYDPILLSSLDAIGAAMHTRLNVEGKPGYGQRSASRFSTWWNGGLRTSVYFHNMIGILTEIVGSPNPSQIPLVLDRILPNSDSPNPIHPQSWNFQKSIDYSISMNFAVLNYAAKNKEDLLYNIYKMGHNSLEKGAKLALSITPRHIDYMRQQSSDEKDKKVSIKSYEDLYRMKDKLDPIAYIIPSDQADFPTAVKFLNRLILSGITIEEITRDVNIEGREFHKGSYLVRLAQAFRPHILDMFEPQDHPHDVEYENGPPIPPYDAAGWTLAYTMGVDFHTVRTPLPSDCSFPIKRGGTIAIHGETLTSGRYFRISPQVNDNFKLVNYLLSSRQEVFRDESGSFYLRNSPKTRSVINQMENVGFKLDSLAALPSGAVRTKSLKIALWDTYGGSMKSGWMRWLLEDFGYDYEIVYNPDIDKGLLRTKFDVIIFPGGGINSILQNKADIKNLPDENIPKEYLARVGDFSLDYSLAAIKQFIEEGGRVITIGSSANLALHLGISYSDPLKIRKDGKGKTLSRKEFYIPGSVLTLKTERSNPETAGLKDRVDIYFDDSPVFSFEKNQLVHNNIRPLLVFDSPAPLKSGWALGQEMLHQTVAAYTADIGKGRLYVFGPEIAFRSQTHGTFKLIFNQLY